MEATAAVHRPALLGWLAGWLGWLHLAAAHAPGCRAVPGYRQLPPARRLPRADGRAEVR